GAELLARSGEPGGGFAPLPKSLRRLRRQRRRSNLGGIGVLRQAPDSPESPAHTPNSPRFERGFPGAPFHGGGPGRGPSRPLPVDLSPLQLGWPLLEEGAR